MTRLSASLRAAAIVAMTVLVPCRARAQQPTPPQPPTAQPAPPAAGTEPAAPIAPKQRRTVEIRAQAPAPEVITVRPREVPQYTRRLLAPALLTYADSAGAARASIVVPAAASAEARAASASDPRTRTP